MTGSVGATLARAGQACLFPDKACPFHELVKCHLEVTNAFSVVWNSAPLRSSALTAPRHSEPERNVFIGYVLSVLPAQSPRCRFAESSLQRYAPKPRTSCEPSRSCSQKVASRQGSQHVPDPAPQKRPRARGLHLHLRDIVSLQCSAAHCAPRAAHTAVSF